MQSRDNFFFSGRLAEIDPAVSELVDVEAERQMRKIIMIASESLCPSPVREALSSEFVNLYAEGYPSTRMSRWESGTLGDHARHLSFFRRYSDKRYYKGTEYADFVEALAQQRCAALFASERIPASGIFVNVQPLSGAAANNAAYEAAVPHGATVMGMALPHGGHLTHGSELNRSGKTFKIIPYEVDPKTGRLDYDRIKTMAEEHDPAMIIAGYSAYPWAVDWKRFREAADAAPSRAVLFADVAHTAGLIAGGVYPSPVGYADIIAFTTHKTMCGPRGAVLMSTDAAMAKKIDSAVFPGEQGGPHINTIAAKAVAFLLAARPEFKDLQRRTVDNASALAEAFKKRGVPLAYGGTDTHLLLADLGKFKTKDGNPLRADAVSRVLDICGLTLNKNTIAGDEKALQPSGLRFGTTIASQRGMGPRDMESIADIVTKLIEGMTAFEITGLGGPVGRVRVPYALFEETRRRISDLAASCARWDRRHEGAYPHFHGNSPAAAAAPVQGAGAEKESKAVESGAAVFDAPEIVPGLARGERAAAMLHGVCSADVINMGKLDALNTLVLDPAGSPRHAVTIARLSDGPDARPRFMVVPGPGARDGLVEYLRALSDGYIEAVPGDCFVKVEGPVVIEDFGLRDSGPAACLYLAGPKAHQVLASACGLGEVKAFKAYEAAIGGLPAVAVADGPSSAFVAAGPQSMPQVRKALAAAGAVQCGTKSRDAWLKSRGFPAACGGPASAFDLAGRLPGRAVDAGKTFFIGQAALLKSSPPKEILKPFEFKEAEGPLRKTPLRDVHAEAGGKMVPFAGWEMPVVYTSIGEEHAAVRNQAGFFDVGHMGVFEASGPDAVRFLDLITSNYVHRLRVGESQYGYLLDPRGGVIDDLMIYHVAPETYMVVVNASNADKDWAWMSAVNGRKAVIDETNPSARIEKPCRFRDLKDPGSGREMRIDLALQGPCSAQILCEAVRDADTAARIQALPKSNNLRALVAGIDVIVSRTGYTGEEWGFELYVHPDRACDLWNAVMKAGSGFGLRPTGLGARDSTRTEAGLPLYGHELAGKYGVNPVEAGYGFFVKWHKPFFVGRKALLDQSRASMRSVIRFEASGAGTRLAKTADPVINRNERVIGYVTSCALAGERQVGMAIVDKRQAKPGSKIGFFSLPRKGKSGEEKPRDELEIGDSVTAPIDASVIERFPRA